jgi:hypothetical protein
MLSLVFFFIPEDGQSVLQLDDNFKAHFFLHVYILSGGFKKRKQLLKIKSEIRNHYMKHKLNSFIEKMDGHIL